jgi:hypothetical protein
MIDGGSNIIIRLNLQRGSRRDIFWCLLPGSKREIGRILICYRVANEKLVGFLFAIRLQIGKSSGSYPYKTIQSRDCQ